MYFSTLGPASYGLGTAGYEERLIADCFGRERLAEYRGKGRLECALLCAVGGTYPARARIFPLRHLSLILCVLPYAVFRC